MLGKYTIHLVLESVLVKTVKFSNRVVINLKERNVDRKEKNSKESLASSKDLNVKLH